MAKNVAGRGDDDDANDRAHRNGHYGVDACGCLDSADIQQRKNDGEENFPAPDRDARRERVCLLRAPDRANQRIEHVIHHHAPSGDVAEPGMNFLRDVGERRTRAGIRARHAAVADAGEEHRHHRDENRGNDVPASTLAENAENRHRRDRLDDDHAVQNQIPKRECAPETGSRAARCDGSFVAQIGLVPRRIFA